MNGGVWSNDDKLARLDTHDLELHRPEAATHQKEVALASRTIGLQEVGLQVRVEEVAREALDGVIQGQDMHALAVRNVTARMDGNDVTEPATEVLAHDLVQADLPIFQVLVGEYDANGVLAFLALDQHIVAAEEIQLLHLRLRQSDDGVVIVQCLLDDQAVRGPLLLGSLRSWDSCGGNGSSLVVCHGCGASRKAASARNESL
mmetsp:Transcript_33468/g.109659  ORF Transcript_33468/g.109659 Transcript_33468/m.109659 type:complete len:203 (+) Transcript_33468:2238-2846(+)